MWDPHPTKLLLTPKEVRDLLSMEQDTFGAFLRENPDFPRALVLPGRRRRERFRKAEVLAWIDRLGRTPPAGA